MTALYVVLRIVYHLVRFVALAAVWLGIWFVFLALLFDFFGSEPNVFLPEPDTISDWAWYAWVAALVVVPILGLLVLYYMVDGVVSLFVDDPDRREDITSSIVAVIVFLPLVLLFIGGKSSEEYEEEDWRRQEESRRRSEEMSARMREKEIRAEEHRRRQIEDYERRNAELARMAAFRR